MQVVVTLAEEKYQNLSEVDATTLRKLIKDGQKLPDIHGKLVDASELPVRDVSPDPWYAPMWGVLLEDIQDATALVDVYEGEEL